MKQELQISTHQEQPLLILYAHPKLQLNLCEASFLCFNTTTLSLANLITVYKPKESQKCTESLQTTAKLQRVI